MNESNLLQTLGQVSSESASEVFRTHLRGLVRQMITDVMAEEVTALCGAKHQPTDETHFRAGLHRSLSPTSTTTLLQLSIAPSAATHRSFLYTDHSPQHQASVDT